MKDRRRLSRATGCEDRFECDTETLPVFSFQNHGCCSCCEKVLVMLPSLYFQCLLFALSSLLDYV